MRARVFIAIMIAVASFLHPTPALSLPTEDGHPLFDESEGMRTLFGNYEPKSGTARSTVPDDRTFDLNGSGFKAGDELVVRPFWRSAYKAGGVQKTVLLTYAVPFDPDWKPIVAGDQPFSCHACAPLIGMAIFAWSNMKWSLEASQSLVTRAGGWGLPPSVVRLVKIGRDRTGVELTPVDEGQGITTTSKQIVALPGSTISKVLNLLVAEDDHGGCDPRQPSDEPSCYSYRKSITFRQGANADYYDIYAVLRGTDYGDDLSVHNVSGIEIFRFSDGGYKSISRRGSVTSTEQAIGRTEPGKTHTR
jgi:hypothetical protein